MALSSSIGSNTFDAAFSLPITWYRLSPRAGGVAGQAAHLRRCPPCLARMLYVALAGPLGHGQDYVPIQSANLWISFVALLATMGAAVAIVAYFRWRLTAVVGMAMFFLYFAFTALALALEYVSV